MPWKHDTYKKQNAQMKRRAHTQENLKLLDEINAVRKDLNLSMEEFAEALGYTEEYVKKVTYKAVAVYSPFLDAVRTLQQRKVECLHK